MLKAFSSSSRPYSSSRPSLYQRSERRWLRAYSLPNRTVPGSPLTLIRSGVDPADPASPNGLTSSISRPSWSGQGAADGLPAGPADVQVGAAAPPVADREDLVGHEPAEGQQRDGHPDDRAEQHVGRGVEAERDPGQARQGDDRGRRPLAGLPPVALRHQRVEDADQARGQDRDLDRRQRIAVPAPVDDDPERPGPLERGRQDQDQLRHHRQGDDVDDEMANAPEHQQRDDDAPREDLGGQPGGGKRRDRHHAGEPAAAQPGEPAHDPVVGGGHRDGGAVAAGGEADHEHGDEPDGGQQPHDTGGLEVPGQWRRRAGGASPAPRVADARRDRGRLAGDLRLAGGGVHEASGPVAAACAQPRRRAAGSNQ